MVNNYEGLVKWPVCWFCAKVQYLYMAEWNLGSVGIQSNGHVQGLGFVVLTLMITKESLLKIGWKLIWSVKTWENKALRNLSWTLRLSCFEQEVGVRDLLMSFPACACLCCGEKNVHFTHIGVLGGT